MESFNKNWLAILLIVFAFTAIGFLLGWTLKPCHGFKHHMQGMHGKVDYFRTHDCSKPFDFHFDDASIDSLKNIDVKVIIDDEEITGDAGGEKKVIVKKYVVKE